MAAPPRSVWIDDSGSGTDGTILANSELQKIYDNVDVETKSLNFPAVTTKSVIDNRMAGGVIMLGGSMAYRRNTSMLTGSTYDNIAYGTGVWKVDSALLTGTYRWEAVISYEPGGSATVSAALVNLTDDPNTQLSGSLITTTVQTGALVRSSALTFALPGVAKDYAIKTWTNNASLGCRVVWSRILRTA